MFDFEAYALVCLGSFFSGFVLSISVNMVMQVMKGAIYR